MSDLTGKTQDIFPPEKAVGKVTVSKLIIKNDQSEALLTEIRSNPLHPEKQDIFYTRAMADGRVFTHVDLYDDVDGYPDEFAAGSEDAVRLQQQIAEEAALQGKKWQTIIIDGVAVVRPAALTA